MENKHSIDYKQIKNDEITTLFDLDKYLNVSGKKRTKHQYDILSEFIDDEILFEKCMNAIAFLLHSSIPESEKETCQLCNTIGSDNEKRNCHNYLIKADEKLELYSYLFVTHVLNNEAIYSTKKIKKELTIFFFELLEYKSGTLEMDVKKLDSMLLDINLEVKRELLTHIDSNENAVLTINKIIYDLKNIKGKAKIYNRTISDYVKPQLKFYKNELLFYTNQLSIHGKKKRVSKKVATPNLTGKLVQFFEHTSKYKSVMEILVTKNLVQAGNYIWIDNKKGSSTLLASLIKTLHAKGYFTYNTPATNPEITLICQNTFSKSIGIDTAKRSPVNNNYFSFIPLEQELE